MKILARILYWPIALLTAIAWVLFGATLAAHDWALRTKEGRES